MYVFRTNIHVLWVSWLQKIRGSICKCWIVEQIRSSAIRWSTPLLICAFPSMCDQNKFMSDPSRNTPAKTYITKNYKSFSRRSIWQFYSIKMRNLSCVWNTSFQYKETQTNIKIFFNQKFMKFSFNFLLYH
jgi:hypothetical protein